MARDKQFGEGILEEDLAIRAVRGLPNARTASAPIEWRKFCLNSYAASAQFQNLLHEATNQACVSRTRQLFTAIAHPNEMAAASTSQPTFRFAFRTSAYQSGLEVFATLQPPLGANGDNASFARLKIFSDVSESVAVSTTDFYYGASPDGVSFSNTRGWSFAKTVRLPVRGLTANTNYYACFYSESAACLQTATVIEKQSMTQNLGGYLPTSINQDSEVLSVYRERLAAIQRNLWKTAGRSLINWTVSDGSAPLTRASSTPINIVDNTSTTVSAATPGYTLDMRYRDRVSQSSGIPVIMKVFCETTSGTNKGRFYLKNSAGTAVMTITDGVPFAPSPPSWLTVTGVLPATMDKYDLQFDNNGNGTLSVYAVSIWEYET